ncbi:MAG: hypothetical protein Q9198_005157, partial [Flavoplaca austrocitrina]
MRYSSVVALALASAVVALPTPQDASTQDPSLAPQDSGSVSNSTSSSSDFSSSGEIAGDFFDMGPTTESGTPATGTETETEPTAPESDGASGSPPADGTSTTPAEGLEPCGEAFYSPEQYTCYDTFLCPIIDGTATLQCGDACYLESLYTCVDDVLQTLNGTAGGDTTGVIPGTGDTGSEDTGSEDTSSEDTGSEETSTDDTDPTGDVPPTTTDTGSPPIDTAASDE